MNYENILFEVKDGIARLTFNRPKALNALNTALLAELSDVLCTIGKDETVRVLVLTGSGEKAFVAGADINELSKLTTLDAKLFVESGQRVIGTLQTLDIPVVGAVNGYALGGGCEIALACDFIYAAENAVFGLPEITLGLIPGFGGTQRLPRLIGINRAKEMIFTGKRVSADEAVQMGLVNQVCPQEKLMDAVMQTAAAMAVKGRVSLRAAKQAINTGLDTALEAGCRFEADAFAVSLASPDAKEGTRAFLEKRKAVFSGRLK